MEQIKCSKVTNMTVRSLWQLLSVLEAIHTLDFETCGQAHQTPLELEWECAVAEDQLFDIDFDFLEQFFIT